MGHPKIKLFDNLDVIVWLLEKRELSLQPETVR